MLNTKPKRYTAEFKQQAVSKLISGKYSLRQLSRELGVSVVSLLKWRDSAPPSAARVARVDIPAPASREERVARDERAPLTDKDEELQRLREEIARLKEERDRLRKGIAYLAGVTD